MSNEAPNAVDARTHGRSSSQRSDGMPDLLWDQILEAGSAAGTALRGESRLVASSEASSRRHAGSASTGVLAALSELAERVERLPGGAAGSNLDGRASQYDGLIQGTPDRGSAQGDNGRGVEVSTQDPISGSARNASNSERNTVGTNEGMVSYRSYAHEHSGMREAASVSLPRRSTLQLEPLPDESRQQFMERQRRASTLHRLERQQDFATRARQMRELRNSISANTEHTPALAPAASNHPPLSNTTSSDPSAVVERSTTARRDLERALRDYRIARRAFRTHLSDSTSPAEQNMPSYQGVMAQIAEQQNNNRNRMRARGQSRTSIVDLERTDDIVGRLAAVAGIGNDEWRTDDDTGTPTAQSPRGGVRAASPTSSEIDAMLAETRLSPRAAMPSEPYLGPNTTAGRNASVSGGMRDFYSRIEGHRNSLRSGFRDTLPILPSATSGMTGITGTGSRRGTSRNLADDLQDAVGRTNDSSTTETKVKTKKPLYNAAKEKARETLSYLSSLKQFHNDRERILLAANDVSDADLGQSLAKDDGPDLPLHINELPLPVSSSWLEAGMSWEGFQKGGQHKNEREIQPLLREAVGPLFGSSDNLENRILRLRAWRHRELVRSERQERQRNQDEQNVVARSEEETRGLLRGLPNDRETLADIERHLSDLLEEEERRISRGGDDEWRVGDASIQARPGTGLAITEKKSEDKWPVKVALHEVNWKKKTVQGSMVASQILGPTTPTASRTNLRSTMKEDDGTSMETLFDGEIIDFRTHEFETVSDKPGYQVGGIMNDIKYWSRVGPFKDEINKKAKTAVEKKALETYGRLGITGTLDEQSAEYKRTFNDQHGVVGELDREEIGIVVYDTMAECLASRKWLEKAMGEDGWIFMRWKERCFTSTPSPHDPLSANSTSSSNTITTSTINEHTRFRTIVSPNITSAPYTTASTNEHHHERQAWGLTIRGFYYVALNRRTGNIDALYFDAGSHPYQELTLHPLGIRRSTWSGDRELDSGLAQEQKKKNKNMTEEGGRSIGVDDNDHDKNDEDDHHDEDEDDDADAELAKFMASINVRCDFGKVEFR